MVAAVASDEPEIAANPAQPPTAAIATPPRQDPAPIDANYFTGEQPVRTPDAGGSSLEERAKSAFNMLADGASQVGSLIRDEAFAHRGNAAVREEHVGHRDGPWLGHGEHGATTHENARAISHA